MHFIVGDCILKHVFFSRYYKTKIRKVTVFEGPSHYFNIIFITHQLENSMLLCLTNCNHIGCVTKRQKGCVKHKQTQTTLFWLSDWCGVEHQRSMWSINPYCVHTWPGAFSSNYPSIMTLAELLVSLVVHLCISKVLHRQMLLPLITIYSEYTIL